MKWEKSNLNLRVRSKAYEQQKQDLIKWLRKSQRNVNLSKCTF